MAADLAGYRPRSHTNADANVGISAPHVGLRVLAALGLIGVCSCGGSGMVPRPSPLPGAGDSLVALIMTCVQSDLIIGQETPCIAAASYRSGRQPIVSLDASWSSSAPHVVEVEATGLIRGKSAGEAEISATYQGKRAAAVVRVTEKDALLVTTGAYGGSFTPGSTVQMWLQGYYSVASATSGRLSLRISDQAGTVMTTDPVTVGRGGDSFVLSSTFIVPASSMELCRQAVLEIGAVTFVEPKSKDSPWCVRVVR